MTPKPTQQSNRPNPKSLANQPTAINWKQSLDVYSQLPDKIDVDNPPRKPIAHLGAQMVLVDDAGIKQAYLDRLASYYAAAAGAGQLNTGRVVNQSPPARRRVGSCTAQR